MPGGTIYWTASPPVTSPEQQEAVMAGRAYQMSWGPYFGQAEASVHLSRFADATVGRETGILFSDGQTCMVLRQPVLDADGLGHSMIARWMPPHPPAPTPGLMQRIENVFERAMTMEGEAAIARAQGEMALGQALARFLGSETGEHAVGMAFDLLGLLAAALLLFVPGVGEAEIGVLAASTGSLAGTGSLLGAIVDGKTEAHKWGHSPAAETLSLLALVLALPDLPIGGMATLRDLRNAPQALDEIEAAGSEAAGFTAKQTTRLAKAERLETDNAGLPAWRVAKRADKATTIRADAGRLAKRAADASNEAHRLALKLGTTAMVNAPASFVGVPVVGGYFARDNWQHPAEPFIAAWHEAGAMRNWAARLLSPRGHAARGPGGGLLGIQMGVSSKSRATRR
ncbi:MAG: hypothetical protein B7X09_00250 [Acidiphilium sp. 21-66-27]|uniref:hypothetical protein n=2 Tax=Acidiphilium TaxID=522 RepID=UPI000BDB11BA|nr:MULTISPECIES: hypothetical protein [unclassified Acidiphilium]OYV54455.1 MAG: hypothetical protein B7Z76_14410 [Acidiphilium sp. 20-67-58]OYV67762.1 MAG: hypothetical protein B7X09_00250 [Acidiphilium sp. 21-66-27]HQT62363.1 hypothetical protein [Acidiphilium sp.]